MLTIVERPAVRHEDQRGDSGLQAIQTGGDLALRRSGPGRLRDMG